ncbi:hypothetical protein HCA54_08240 [Listeria welshimeri]|nr:hypothetical protein [Listeria welshimeri]
MKLDGKRQRKRKLNKIRRNTLSGFRKGSKNDWKGSSVNGYKEYINEYILGAGFSAKTYDVIDERLRF